jgi:cytochrome c-type biogenesis protein
MENVSFIMAFGAGFLTFLSPCLLPLIPAYISYLTGISFHDVVQGLTEEEKRKARLTMMLHSLSFILGFSIVFMLLGLSFSLVGQLLFQYQWLIKRIGGVLIILLALIIMHVIKLPFLEKEKKFSYTKEGVSILGSVLVGATFAAAWTPCVSPILGSILVYASSTASLKTGMALLLAFSLGLAVPFFLSALLIQSFLTLIKRIEKYIRFITVVFGIILIIFGFTLLIGG